MDELKPCPFCGSDNVRMDTDYGVYFVLCVNCQTEGPDDPDKSTAIKLWNGRPIEAPLLREVDRLGEAFVLIDALARRHAEELAGLIRSLN